MVEVWRGVVEVWCGVVEVWCGVMEVRGRAADVCIHVYKAHRVSGFGFFRFFSGFEFRFRFRVSVRRVRGYGLGVTGFK